MAYSFTEKKRIRKNFGKRPSILGMPYLLAIQLDSYRRFLQADTPETSRDDVGLHAAFDSVFPISSYSGNATLEYVSYRLGEPVFDVKECQLRGPHLRGAAARQSAPRGARQGSERRQEAGQGRARAGGLPGRAAAHDRERHLHHQRHRARDRLAAAPQPGRVLRSRPRQDALVRQTAVLRAHHSLPRLVAGLRVRPEGLRVRAHRPAPQAAGHHHPARARLHRGADPRHVLREEHVPPVEEGNQLRDRAAAPARRNRLVRDPRRREGHRRGRPAHHRAPRAPARGGRRQAAAGAERVPAGQGAGARRGQHRHRRDPREGQRDPHRPDGGQADRGRHHRGPHAVTSTIWIAARTSRTRCASIRPRRAWRRWSRSIA